MESSPRGATGSGKTFVACALAHQACHQKQSVLYRRVPELVTALARARDKGTHARLMGRLARVSLLVLDDWGLQGFSAEGRRELLEITEARHGRRSILIASQIPVENWPEVISDARPAGGAERVLPRRLRRTAPAPLPHLRRARGTKTRKSRDSPNRPMDGPAGSVLRSGTGPQTGRRIASGPVAMIGASEKEARIHSVDEGWL